MFGYSLGVELPVAGSARKRFSNASDARKVMCLDSMQRSVKPEDPKTLNPDHSSPNVSIGSYALEVRHRSTSTRSHRVFKVYRDAKGYCY